MPISALRSSHTAFGKHEKQGKGRKPQGRARIGRMRGLASHMGARQGGSRGSLVCGLQICFPHLSQVAQDPQLFNLWQISCWAVDKGLDLGHFLNLELLGLTTQPILVALTQKQSSDLEEGASEGQ